MLNVRKAVVAVMGALLGIVIITATDMTVMASNHTKVLESLNSGLGIVLDKPGYPGVGTSRYIVDFDDPTTAEWAVTVVDQVHGQGIGVVLFYAICVVRCSMSF